MPLPGDAQPHGHVEAVVEEVGEERRARPADQRPDRIGHLVIRMGGGEGVGLVRKSKHQAGPLRRPRRQLVGPQVLDASEGPVVARPEEQPVFYQRRRDMTKIGPRDDTKVAAIKLEWWPRSDWNKWPPSLESTASG